MAYTKIMPDVTASPPQHTTTTLISLFGQCPILHVHYRLNLPRNDKISNMKTPRRPTFPGKYNWKGLAVHQSLCDVFMLLI